MGVSRGALPSELTRGAALRRELVAVGFLLAALFLTGVLLSKAVAALGAANGGGFGVVGNAIGGPLLTGFGWAGAIFVPIAPAVHSLRLFGRLGRRTDRDWLLFLGGLVLLAPIVAALVLDVGAQPEASAAAGVWGGFVAGSPSAPAAASASSATTSASCSACRRASTARSGLQASVVTVSVLRANSATSHAPTVPKSRVA